MPQLSLDSLESLLAVLGSVGGFVVFLGAFWWKLSAKVKEVLTTLAAVVSENGKLRVQIAHSAKISRQAVEALGTKVDTLAGVVADLERGLAVQATILGEREKDVVKLEAKLEQAHDDTLKVISSLTQVMGSTDALWRTLQKLHPTEVPRRASERK